MWRHDCTCNVCVCVCVGRGGELISGQTKVWNSKNRRWDTVSQFQSTAGSRLHRNLSYCVRCSSNLGRSWGALDAWTFAHTLGHPGKLLQSELREETCGLLSSGSSKSQARLPVRSAPSEEPREDPPLLPQLLAAPSLKLTADGTCADPSLKALSHPLSIFYTISFSLIR